MKTKEELRKKTIEEGKMKRDEANNNKESKCYVINEGEKTGRKL